MTSRRPHTFARLCILGAASATAACALALDMHDVDYGPVESDGQALLDHPEVGDAATDRAQGDGGFATSELCDRDRDGVWAANSECAGSDCDDSDPRVHPDAGFLTNVPPDGSSGDWNCDGVVTMQYPSRSDDTSCTNVECAAFAGGFTGEAGCGQQASYATCAFVIGTGACQRTYEMRVQGCR